MSGLPVISEINGERVTATARPDFVPDPNDEKPGIYLIDDYNRAMDHILQAIMRLSQFGEFRGWKLPKHCVLVLTGNDDDTSYNITSTDAAQCDRMYTVNMRFDLKSWLNWATTPAELADGTMGTKIDGRIVGMTTKVFLDHADLSGLPWGTPRETERLSNLILGVDDMAAVDLARIVNPQFAVQMSNYIEFRSKLPSVAEILKMEEQELQNMMARLDKTSQYIIIYDVANAVHSTITRRPKGDVELANKVGVVLNTPNIPKDIIAGVIALLDSRWASLIGRMDPKIVSSFTKQLGLGIEK